MNTRTLSSVNRLSSTTSSSKVTWVFWEFSLCAPIKAKTPKFLI